MKSPAEIFTEYTEAVDEMGKYCYFNNIKFSNPQTQAIIPFILSSFILVNNVL